MGMITRQIEAAASTQGVALAFPHLANARNDDLRLLRNERPPKIRNGSLCDKRSLTAFTRDKAPGEKSSKSRLWGPQWT
jgi:hypothetical protein